MMKNGILTFLFAFCPGAASPPIKQTQVIAFPYPDNKLFSKLSSSGSPTSSHRWGL